MNFYAVLTKGGTSIARNVQADDEAGVRVQYDMRGKIVVPLDRALGDFETVALDGTIAEDADARKAHRRMIVDRDFCEKHGADAIERVHLYKASQAQRVIDGGTCLLIEGEARLRGVSADELAQSILDKHLATTIADELERQRAKLAIDPLETPAAATKRARA